MSQADSTSVFDAAAQAYDRDLVPAFFDEWAGHVAAAGWARIVGVDPSAGMLAQARARAVPGAE